MTRPDGPTLIVADVGAFREWLRANGTTSDGVWLVLAKKNTTDPTSLSYAQALEEALCQGWIDGQKRSRDDATFVQRFTPRRRASIWSKRNVGITEQLIAEGRMRPAGLAEIERAKADGRWDAAYSGQASAADRRQPVRRALPRRDREATRDQGATHRTTRGDAGSG